MANVGMLCEALSQKSISVLTVCLFQVTAWIVSCFFFQEEDPRSHETTRTKYPGQVTASESTRPIFRQLICQCHHAQSIHPGNLVSFGHRSRLALCKQDDAFQPKC